MPPGGRSCAHEPPRSEGIPRSEWRCTPRRTGSTACPSALPCRASSPAPPTSPGPVGLPSWDDPRGSGHGLPSRPPPPLAGDGPANPAGTRGPQACGPHKSEAGASMYHERSRSSVLAARGSELPREQDHLRGGVVTLRHQYDTPDGGHPIRYAELSIHGPTPLKRPYRASHRPHPGAIALAGAPPRPRDRRTASHKGTKTQTERSEPWGRGTAKVRPPAGGRAHGGCARGPAGPAPAGSRD